MLEKVTHIEGLQNSYENIPELLDDVDPSATRVEFLVKAEEMPFLTEQKGEVVRKNFVRIRTTVNLGNLVVERRIKDKVEFDEATNSWKVLSTAKGKTSQGHPVSDILRCPNEWNAFARNQKAEPVGTPIGGLFKHDPARAEMYKSRGIETIEQLVGCNDQNISDLGMGARGDQNKAKKFLEVARAHVQSGAVNHKLEELSREKMALEGKVADLEHKLTELLKRELEAGEAKPAKKAKKAESSEQIGA